MGERKQRLIKFFILSKKFHDIVLTLTNEAKYLMTINLQQKLLNEIEREAEMENYFVLHCLKNYPLKDNITSLLKALYRFKASIQDSSGMGLK